MAVAKESKTRVSQMQSRVQKVAGAFGKTDNPIAKELEIQGVKLSRREIEALSIETYLSQRERQKYERMSPEKKRHFLDRAKRGTELGKAVRGSDSEYDVKKRKNRAKESTQNIQGESTERISERKHSQTSREMPIHLAKEGGKEASKEVAKEGSKKAAETATSLGEGVATGGTSEAVKLGVKVAKKGASLVQEAVKPPEQQQMEMGDTPTAPTGPAEKIASLMATWGTVVVATITPILLGILAPVIMICSFISLFAGILGPIADITNRVSQYENEVTQAIFAEAFQWEGGPYLFGGTDPATGIDCSAFTQWCYRAAGLELPRTAQAQYDITEHLDFENAKPGDLVFFSGTYDTENFITHVELYAGDGKSYGAGNPIGYHDLNSNYYKSHLVCFGRLETGGE
ncbi:MAG: C40 family peptidase [Lachnospiraceae bacterium]|nr:C40 family peptidase [Lachnospiraceae bacterium]